LINESPKRSKKFWEQSFSASISLAKPSNARLTNSRLLAFGQHYCPAKPLTTRTTPQQSGQSATAHPGNPFTALKSTRHFWGIKAILA